MTTVKASNNPIDEATKAVRSLVRAAGRQRELEPDEDIKLSSRVLVLIQGEQYNEAQQLLRTIEWSSDNSKIVGLARIWSLAVEQALPEKVKGFLRAEIPIGRAMPYLNPSWRPKEWKFTRLLNFNPDLMLEMSRNLKMEYAWLALKASLQSHALKGEQAISLWNNLLATESVQGNLRGSEILLLLKTMESNNNEAIEWMLEKIKTPERHGQPQTVFEFLAYGLSCTNKEEMTGDKLGRLLTTLSPRVIGEIDWSKLDEGLDPDVVGQAKIMVERARLEKIITVATTSPTNKLHL